MRPLRCWTEGGQGVPEGRHLPHESWPSDHVALVCDFQVDPHPRGAPTLARAGGGLGAGDAQRTPPRDGSPPARRHRRFSPDD